MTDAVLVLNAGSSSVRCALYARTTLEPLCRAHIDAIGAPTQGVTWSGALAPRCADATPPPAGDHASVIGWLVQTLHTRLVETQIVIVGQRVVHGGSFFAGAAVIDASVLTEIERLTPLAPSHHPHSLAAIRAVAAKWPELPQVACFDTAFHRNQPRLHQLYALPRELSDAGILRFGFHGLSYEFLAGQLPRLAGARADGRVILAHLGHGASMCALRERRSIATTMGFSTLDGLMMSTRCGTIDPGVLLYLQQVKNLAPEQVADLLYNRSGLLGVSGISDDLRVLEASDDPRALEAIDLFAYRAACTTGSLAAALGGIDVFVFSAGIGEHSADMRARICARLDWLGVRLDAQANAQHRACISAAMSSIDVFVIPTDEEIVIAGSARDLIGDRHPGNLA